MCEFMTPELNEAEVLKLLGKGGVLWDIETDCPCGVHVYVKMGSVMWGHLPQALLGGLLSQGLVLPHGERRYTIQHYQLANGGA